MRFVASEMSGCCVTDIYDTVLIRNNRIGNSIRLWNEPISLKIAVTDGTTMSVRKVEKASPPITVMARGVQRLDSSVLLMAIGRSPRMVVMAVMIMGRRRSAPAVKIARSKP